jgi:hypothetical protein
MDANQNRTFNGTLEWILFDPAMRTRPADHQTVTLAESPCRCEAAHGVGTFVQFVHVR